KPQNTIKCSIRVRVTLFRVGEGAISNLPELARYEEVFDPTRLGLSGNEAAKAAALDAVESRPIFARGAGLPKAGERSALGFGAESVGVEKINNAFHPDAERESAVRRREQHARQQGRRMMEGQSIVDRLAVGIFGEPGFAERIGRVLW